MTRRAISSRSALSPVTRHASRRGGARVRMSVLDKTAARGSGSMHGMSIDMDSARDLHGDPRPHARPAPLRACSSTTALRRNGGDRRGRRLPQPRRRLRLGPRAGPARARESARRGAARVRGVRGRRPRRPRRTRPSLCDWCVVGSRSPDGGLPFALPVADPRGLRRRSGRSADPSDLVAPDHGLRRRRGAPRRLGSDPAVTAHPWLAPASCVRVSSPSTRSGATISSLRAGRSVAGMLETSPSAAGEAAARARAPLWHVRPVRRAPPRGGGLSRTRRSARSTWPRYPGRPGARALFAEDVVVGRLPPATRRGPAGTTAAGASTSPRLLPRRRVLEPARLRDRRARGRTARLAPHGSAAARRVTPRGRSGR